MRAGHLDDFLAAVADNALHTFSDEPGCRYFDVVQDQQDDHNFVFYEVYDDVQALEAHRTAPHFRRWREAAGVHVVEDSQTNRVGTRLIHHSEDSHSAALASPELP